VRSRKAERDEGGAFFNRSVSIPAGEQVVLEGDLTIPEGAKDIVLFAHGSGSSRYSPRNRYVASILNEQGMATLLVDLLTDAEEIVDDRTRHLRFDIPMLAERLSGITNWVMGDSLTHRFGISYFGASTGAAAALMAAAGYPQAVKAVVSRGGRPDLAREFLPKVKAPTLLIVGEHDPEVIRLNKEALGRLNNRSRLEIVPRATHLFEEPGALEAAARLAAAWFGKHGV
jgi:pimeloyl-ACP methyl ester carboxylesterase